MSIKRFSSDDNFDNYDEDFDADNYDEYDDDYFQDDLDADYNDRSHPYDYS